MKWFNNWWVIGALVFVIYLWILIYLAVYNDCTPHEIELLGRRGWHVEQACSQN